MKKGIKVFCKVLSVFLAMLFILEVLPTQVMADAYTAAVAEKEYIEDILNNPTNPENNTDADILYEVEEKRDEYTKVYKKSDGTYTAIMTEEPLHYLDEGVWKEIDNSMILDGNLYTNLSNLFNVELPKNIDENKELTVQKDGYELSFSVDNIDNSSAVVENNIVISDTEIADADSAIAQTQSAVTYNNITDNTNLQYIVTANSIKENIIVSNKESVKDKYTFTFETNGLTAEKQSDGSVLFKDVDGDVKFTIPRPVMTDANFAFSYDIGVSLTENANGTVTLEYAPSIDWTSSSDRIYPITIDPAIMVDNKDVSWVEDTYVIYDSTNSELQNDNAYNDYVGVVADKTVVENGNEQYYNAEIYTKFNIEAFKPLTENIILTEVQYLFASATIDGSALAKKIAEPVDLTTVTYANKPDLENESFDYYTSPYVEGDDAELVYAHFNVTKPLTEWLNGAENNGFAIVAGNPNFIGIFITNGVYSYTNPTTNVTTTTKYSTAMTIDYVEANGYNEVLDYHSQSAGRAGTGYVNDFTQILSVLRDDISIDGIIMPVTVGMIYDSATYDRAVSMNHSDILAYGNNWTPNYLRAFLIGEEDQFTYYTDTGASIDYTYSVENGEVVFKEIYSDIYGEHGYQIEYFAATDTQAEYITMTRPDGYVERFSSDGLLVSVTNPDYPEQTINVIYDSVGRINYITDGIGRKYDYIYNTATNLLLKIKCYSADGAAIYAGTTNYPLEVNYTYDSNKNLTSVTYPDGKAITYEYNENGDLTYMTNIDGYRVEYKYNDDDPDNDAEEVVTNRVKKVIEWAWDEESESFIQGNNITYDTSNHPQVTLIDGNGNYETYQFNICGKLLYTTDSNGNYFLADSATTNDTYFVSNLSYRANSENLLLNPSFEEDSDSNNIPDNWTITNSAFVRTGSTNAHFGDYEMYSSNTGSTNVKQTVQVLGNGQYTFSAYVKSDSENNGKLYMKVSALSKSNTVLATKTAPAIESTAGEWVRYSVTIPAPTTNLTTAKVTVEFRATDGGLFSVDDVQLEQASSASSFNYINNGGFRNGTSYWTNANGMSVVDETVNGKKAKALTLTGGLNTSNSICQDVIINGKKGDIFTVGGWLKGSFIKSTTNNVLLQNAIAENPDTPILNFTNDRFAQIEVTYQYQQGNEESESETITEKIVIPFAENLDDWQFAAQSFELAADCEKITVSVHYTNNTETAYLSNLEVTKDMDAITLSEDDNNACACDNCEDASCTCACESEVSCTCPSCTRRSNVTTTDSFGNITSNSSIDGEKTIQTTSQYTTDGNYLDFEIDADGNKIDYTYNQLNGALTAIKDGNQNTTSYTYDAYGLLTSVSAINTQYVTGTELTCSANYVYENDRLVSISHNGFSYNLSYDIWGQLTEVSVGAQKIVSYTYGEFECRDRVSTITYHNGNYTNSESVTTEYYYDIPGNIVEILVDDVTKYRYEYDSLGNLITNEEVDVRTTTYIDGTTEVIDNNDTRIYTSFTSEDGKFIEIVGGVEYISESYNSIYNPTTGITTEKNDVQIGNNKVIGTVAEQDWFGRYTESVVKTESANDANEENTFAAVKTEYTYPKYDVNEETGDYKTSNRVETYVNKVYNGTDTTDGNLTDYYGFSYDYDANGNIIAEYEYDAEGGETLRYSYVYDELNQLVRYNDNVSSPRRSYTFTYDAAGNIISKSTYAYRTGTLGTALSTVNYDYDDTWTDKLTEYNGTAISYDDIGNPTSLMGATLSWSGRQLDTYTKVDGTVIEYSYDENGLRHEKSIYVNDVLTEKYNYTWANGRLINQVYTVYENNTPTSYAVKFIYDSFDTPQGFILNNDETYLYLKNIQGDIIAVVNESGESVLTYTYNAWGKFTQTVGAGDNNTVELMKKFLPFAYRGYCYDYDTGLYYLQSRYYSPEIGRFINTDDTQIAIATQGTILGANLFAYCNNNPTNEIDISGYLSIKTITAGLKSLGKKAWSLIQPLINEFVWKPGHLGLKIFEIIIDSLFNLLPFTKAFKFVTYKSVTKHLVETAFKNVGKSIVSFFVKLGLKITLNTLISTINKITFGGNIYRFFTVGGIICYIVDKYDGKVDYFFNYGKYKW